MSYKTLLIPISFVIIGVSTWIIGNLIGDKEGGTNLALMIVGGGLGIARQDPKQSTIESSRIQNVNVEETK